MQISRERFDACLFDLDGVLTKTARVHARAWKQVFDAFLASQGRDATRPFDAVRDYEDYVDGKPRDDGVRSFLRARGLTLPEGSPADPPSVDSVWGLGNRKNEIVLALLAEHGVEVYEDSVRLLRAVRAQGMRTAVVSSSTNCAAVLSAARLAASFDVRVDGHTVLDEHLRGKPAPDTYLHAAGELSVEPARAVVLEDAIAGVEAGRAGAFGLVVGVDRKNDAEALRAHGADVVVRDLSVLAAEADAGEPGKAP